MRAVVYEGPRRLAVRDKPDPRIEEPTDAILRVEATGICGSDLHLYHGKVPGVPRGTTLGHEVVGIAEEAGPAAGVVPGRRYVAAYCAACGGCPACLRRQWRNCRRYVVFGHGETLGSLEGAQSEYVRVPLSHMALAEAPDDVPTEALVLLSDNLPTAFSAIAEGGLRPGDSVAIVGAGPVGLLTALCAQVCGASEIVVLDVRAERLHAAESLGVKTFLAEDAEEAVEHLHGGADLVVEAVGKARSLETAWRVARRGASVALVGMLIDEPWPASAGESWLKWLSVKPIFGDPFSHRYRLLSLLRSGRLDPTPVLAGTYPLEDAVDLYARYDKGELLKAVLAPG